MANRTKSRNAAAADKVKSSPAASVPKPPKLVIGEELEYRVARLHIFMGYFVRRACPIFTIANLDQATDLDVLAVTYNHPLRRQMIIAECKSGAVGPLDRIFWLSGVKNFVGAREAFLFRKGTKWNIKDFARSTGVQILDIHKVEELESNYRIGHAEWPGISDRHFYETHAIEWNRGLDNSQGYWDLYQTLITEIRFDEPFAAINYLMFQLRRLTKHSERAPGVFHRFLISESLSQLSVFLMRIAEVAFDLSAKDREAYIIKGLTYGSLDPKFAERILSNAYTITKQAVFHVTNQPIDIDKSFFEMPAPPGTDQVHALVDEILKTYPLSLTLSPITDLLLTEVIVKQNRTNGWLKRVFPYSDLAARLELTKLYLRQLIDVDACPKFVLDSLQVASAENGTRADTEVAHPTTNHERSSNAKTSDQLRISGPPNQQDSSAREPAVTSTSPTPGERSPVSKSETEVSEQRAQSEQLSLPSGNDDSSKAGSR